MLDLASDETQPLLERVKFCSIFSSNLDEFFMVRVAGLMGQEAAGFAVRSADGMTPAQALAGIRARIPELTTRQARLWSASSSPRSPPRDVEILAIEDCTDKELQRLEVVFQRDIYPVLTPLAVGSGQPFPYISGLSLSLGVLAVDPDTGGGAIRPRQGARRARSVRQHGKAARAPRVGDRALPARALPRDGDLRAGAVQGHA